MENSKTIITDITGLQAGDIILGYRNLDYPEGNFKT